MTEWLLRWTIWPETRFQSTLNYISISSISPEWISAHDVAPPPPTPTHPLPSLIVCIIWSYLDRIYIISYYFSLIVYLFTFIIAACPAIDSQILASQSPYRSDTSCEWTIPIPFGRVLTITIRELEIETDSSTSHNASCPYDFLTINSVPYCGDWVPPEYSS